MSTEGHFNGENNDNYQRSPGTDTRTRLYYTAKINDNLKLVNKFEYGRPMGPPVAFPTVTLARTVSPF